MTQTIRNFSIIAHIDHGKSTLADRMLEKTQTITERAMQNQVLDSMELERERGITIKMQPVRMAFAASDGRDYVLNLIDTPGHIDFSYEVSRALQAVEGSILLVDATQGVQAQTFTTLDMAQKAGLVIIPVLSKVDAPHARIDDVKLELAELLGCDLDDILETSGKTGEGVEDLLEAVIARIPAPQSMQQEKQPRALVFDFEYSDHRGVIVYVRMQDGIIQKGDSVSFAVSKNKFQALEVGTFSPDEQPKDALETGEIGYIVTGIKEAGVASVGDTVVSQRFPAEALPGYQVPTPVVWASLYPESQDDFATLKTALGRLRLSDSSFTYEEETSGTLGRGFRVGVLGMLHLEIITERLRREFDLDLIITSPTVIYDVETKKGERETIYSPVSFPDYGDIAKVREPWVSLKIITPGDYFSGIMQILHDHEGEIVNSESFGDNRTQLRVEMPLRELMRNFFDDLKSVSSGYASLSYEMAPDRPADVTRLDVLVAGEPVPAFTRVVSRLRAQTEAEEVVEKLYDLLPQQLFVVKIQAMALGRILSSKTLKALRKDVTGHLYGGDITRKMKLREKQKKGKKRMAAQGKVSIPQDVFLKVMKR
jgi:GTP-binding protein LepA